MFRRRAISDLLTPARCSFRISAACMAAVAGRPSRFPFARARAKPARVRSRKVEVHTDILTADTLQPRRLFGGAPAFVILDAQSHAVLAQDWLGQRNRFLAAFEGLAELLEAVHILVPATRHGGVQGERAALFGSLDRGIEGRDSGFIPRITHVQDEAHLVAFHFLAERLDGFRIRAGEPGFHDAKTQIVAVFHEVERFGTSAACPSPYGNARRGSTQIARRLAGDCARPGSTARYADAAPAAPSVSIEPANYS